MLYTLQDTAKKKVFLQLFFDIRYWIGAFFLLRLFHIAMPAIEFEHCWRQLYTLSVARNFYEQGIDMFFPKINHSGGNGGGIAGCEFPFFNALIALVSYIFGYREWYGRIINLSVSTVGIYFYYLSLKKYIDPLYRKEGDAALPTISFFATLLLLSSIWFSYSRKIMPDTFSISLVFIAVYFGLNFLYDDSKKIRNIALYTFFASLGVLCKMPAVAILTIFASPFLDKSIKLPLKIQFAIASLVVAGLLGAWYFAWVPYLVETYNNPLFFPTGLKQGAAEVWREFSSTRHRFTQTALYSSVGVIAMLVGFLLLFWQRKLPVLISCGTMLLIFVLYIFKTGSVFSFHTYYIIPIVPLLVFFAATAIQELQSRLPANYVPIAWLIVGVIMLQGVRNQWFDLYCNPQFGHRTQLEALVTKFCPDKNEPIFVTDQYFMAPSNTYFSHHPAFPIDDQQLKDVNFLRGLKGWKPRYLFFDKINNTGYVPYPTVYEDGYYRVYKTNYR